MAKAKKKVVSSKPPSSLVLPPACIKRYQVEVPYGGKLVVEATCPEEAFKVYMLERGILATIHTPDIKVVEDGE